MKSFDVVIIGAGAAGLMCAMAAGQRGRKVVVLDHNERAGEKIRVSGGGRCNFTNRFASPSHYISVNPHFCRSALAGYSADDFISLVKRHKISFQERDHGQLFCDQSAEQITEMLLAECKSVEVSFQFKCEILEIQKSEDRWQVETSCGPINSSSLVIATGGKSIPKMGATSFGMDFAIKQGLPIVTPTPALVPLVFSDTTKDDFAQLAGVSLDVEISCARFKFREALLFTHRGISGPAGLQISLYWQEGMPIFIDLIPGVKIDKLLLKARHSSPKQDPVTIISELIPRRLAKMFVTKYLSLRNMAELSDKELNRLAHCLNNWELTPCGTEGYRTAEVTRGGVDTKVLSQKTFECCSIPGLYFIGEVVDVTGQLGGFNFQWAWSSGFAAGQSV